ncbi:MAG: hypothetical protein LBN93_07695 [Candidatus Symbiothrix sp.]|jgi:predicted MPP superfamily phosphohydrolase|nr:hypothetical protein [Candidatus Symbiothrix sp.]
MHKYLIKRALNKHYKRNVRDKRFLNLKDMQTILVLFDTKNTEEITVFINQLKQLKKKVTVYAYKDKDDETDYSRTNYRIITAKETDDLFQKKLREIVHELENEQFDAVIDLTIQRNLPLEYLLAHINATIKVGLKKNDFPQYDLSITTIPELEKDSLKVRELAKQIIHYLQTIQESE